MCVDSEGDRSGLRLTVTSERQRYMQGILLMLSGGESLPPHVPSKSCTCNQLAFYHVCLQCCVVVYSAVCDCVCLEINVPISCSYEGKTELFPIGFRTHAHNQGNYLINMHELINEIMLTCIARVP